MLRLLRLLLLVGIALLMVGAVAMGVGSQTGPAEKAVLVAFGGMLLYVAARVNRLGAARAPR